MRTVVLDPESSGLEELLERRRCSGLDRLDEAWDGVLHLVPAPSLENARTQQALALILGPKARAAGLIAAMAAFNLGESEHDYASTTVACTAPAPPGSGCPPPRSLSRSSHPGMRPRTSFSSTPPATSTRS
jgi:hypothetical protein